MIQQIAAVYYLVAFLVKVFEEFTFAVREFAFFFPEDQCLFIQVKLVFTNTDRIAIDRYRIFFPDPQGILDPHDQLFDTEGFADIVIGADLKTLHHIFGLRFGRQENDGYIIIQFADIFCQFKTTPIGQHHIQDTDIGLRCFECFHYIGAITFHHHFKTPEFEGLFYDLA